MIYKCGKINELKDNFCIKRLILKFLDFYNHFISIETKSFIKKTIEKVMEYSLTVINIHRKFYV